MKISQNIILPIFISYVIDCKLSAAFVCEKFFYIKMKQGNVCTFIMYVHKFSLKITEEQQWCSG